MQQRIAAGSPRRDDQAPPPPPPLPAAAGPPAGCGAAASAAAASCSSPSSSSSSDPLSYGSSTCACWRDHSSAYFPPSASSSWCDPLSTTRPCREGDGGAAWRCHHHSTRGSRHGSRSSSGQRQLLWLQAGSLRKRPPGHTPAPAALGTPEPEPAGCTAAAAAAAAAGVAQSLPAPAPRFGRTGPRWTGGEPPPRTSAPWPG